MKKGFHSLPPKLRGSPLVDLQGMRDRLLTITSELSLCLDVETTEGSRHVLEGLARKVSATRAKINLTLFVF